MKSYVFSNINQQLQLLDALLQISKENRNGWRCSDVIHLVLVGVRNIYFIMLELLSFLLKVRVN